MLMWRAASRTSPIAIQTRRQRVQQNKSLTRPTVQVATLHCSKLLKNEANTVNTDNSKKQVLYRNLTDNHKLHLPLAIFATAPGIVLIPFILDPIYFYVAAPAAWILGIADFLYSRIVISSMSREPHEILYDREAKKVTIKTLDRKFWKYPCTTEYWTTKQDWYTKFLVAKEYSLSDLSITKSKRANRPTRDFETVIADHAEHGKSNGRSVCYFEAKGTKDPKNTERARPYRYRIELPEKALVNIEGLSAVLKGEECDNIEEPKKIQFS